MIPRICQARYVREYVIWLQFEDGVSGEVDLKGELWGEVFEPLKDVEEFKRFSVSPDVHTVVWANGADFSPEFLRSRLKVMA